MGNGVSLKRQSRTADTHTGDQEEMPHQSGNSQNNVQQYTMTQTYEKKQPIAIRENEENCENSSENSLNVSKVQPPRPGFLSPIDKTNINVSNHKPNPNKRRHKEQKQRLKELEHENYILRSELESLKIKHHDVVIQSQVLKQEADDLRLRMSKMASDRLTDNNPNITDLSDENRAINVGEKFCELYSNEWSDVFEELTVDGRMSDKEAIEILLDLLMMIYDECKRRARQDIDNIKQAIQYCTGYVEFNEKLSTSLKLFKVERKLNFKATIPELLTTLEIVLPNEEKTETKRSYVRVTSELCWLMCIHDPPLVLQYCVENERFNESNFSSYTKIGDKVDFLVWPALLLHDNGPLIQKGVAQGK